MTDKPEQEKIIENYFSEIDSNVQLLYKIAEEARSQNLDPEPTPSVVLARDMAERVEGLISTVAPQIKNKGVSKRIRELEKKFGFLDWRVALKIAEEVTKEKFCKFKDKIEAMEIGIRTGFAYLTLGTVASPLEGFVQLKIKKRKDGKEYVCPFYSGPIRSAGGTAASVSVIIVDYVRIKMGYSAYDPTEKEVKRYSSELYDYHERITNLQYLPSHEEIEFMTKNLPVQVGGDPSEKKEVSNYKDLERVETNIIRNGVCLTVGEGLCQKAKKVWKKLSIWGHDFELGHWDFLEEFLKIQKEVRAKSSATSNKKDGQSELKVPPNYTFIKDLVAGRPVLTHPLAPGGFRLRYGRCRTSGYSASCLHPATMVVLDDYIGTGTQLKVERPGKATTVSPCNTIEGPIVKLKDGSVLLLNTEKQARKYLPEVEEILFLGDILFCYGDFMNRAHTLITPGYCVEWWVQELEKKIVDLFGSLDTIKLSELVGMDSENLDYLLKNPFKAKISTKAAINLTKSINIPLHPDYTYHWKLINKQELFDFISLIEEGHIETEGGKILKLILPLDKRKIILENMGIPHLVTNNEFIVLEKDTARAIAFTLNFFDKSDLAKTKAILESTIDKKPLEMLNTLQHVFLRDKSGYFIGARMGRPEKAKPRKLTGSPHVLFPVGEEGGRLKSFQSSLESGNIRADFPIYRCKKCNTDSVFPTCDECGSKAKRMYFCKICGLMESRDCKIHGPNLTYKIQDFDIKKHLKLYLKKLKMNVAPDLIKGVRTTSNRDHTPEHLMKGILRAHHGVYVNKDGTIRYDMTQQPITHFKPKEIGTQIEKLKELGYIKDIEGKLLEDENQILEILPQDVILPKSYGSGEEGAQTCFLKVSKFIDDLLIKFYNLPPYYNLKSPEDLAGHLTTILAPHTSAGIVARIIGFSDTQGLYASPVIHAATRRDCDGDEACAILLLDNFLNFSKEYLPAHRGSKQDAPLIITSKLIPQEVDDMVFDLDVEWKYPLSFYNACLEYKKPWEINFPLFGKRLATPKQYYDFGFTHHTNNINSGVTCSAYKTLPSMKDKLTGQMILAEKIRAVDESDVARIVIEKHFIRDIKGNLRKFSTQGFRCVKCNAKYRRPPLSGTCDKCPNGKIIFTVSEGSIVKYLEPTISLSEKYNLSPYLKQTIFLVKKMIENIFGRDKEKQVGLGMWFD
ncbi:MAG: DNA polymerase II large subunit [Nanoarchaeota archaeon]|nr:DNA polymerase II large subunit [Nanoarchaeota archaeon]